MGDAFIGAESALKDAEPALREKEHLLELEKQTFRAEIEALLKEEGEDLSEEEIANLVSSEEDSPVLQELNKQICVMRAVFDDLRHQVEEKKAALVAVEAAAESAGADLKQLEKEEQNAELPPLTAYYLSQELVLVNEHLKRHESAQNEMLANLKQRREEWVTTKASLHEELHQADMYVELAKKDLEAVQTLSKVLKQ